MNGIIIVGYIGSLLVSVTFLPQVIHTYRIKDASGISKVFMITNLIGTTCMLVYGLYENLLPVLISNCIILTFLILLTILMILFRKKTED